MRFANNNQRYAFHRNYDNALQRFLPTTVLWFTSNRFASKSNYPRGEYTEKPRIKKHWDLRKISTRYKSRPPRNLLFLVPIPHSLSRRQSIAVSRMRTSKSFVFRVIKGTTLTLVAGDFAIVKCINARLDEDVNRQPSMAKRSSVFCSRFRGNRYVNIHGNFMDRKGEISRQLKTWFDYL